MNGIFFIDQSDVSMYVQCMYNRYHSRFFMQLGHETTYAPSGNKHFFTKSCHRQTYQNY